MCRPDDYPPYEDVPRYAELTRLRNIEKERNQYISAAKRMRGWITQRDMHLNDSSWAQGYRSALRDWYNMLREVQDNDC